MPKYMSKSLAASLPKLMTGRCTAATLKGITAGKNRRERLQLANVSEDQVVIDLLKKHVLGKRRQAEMLISTAVS